MRSTEITTTARDDAPRVDDAGAVRGPCLFLVLHCDAPTLGGARFCLDQVDEVKITRGPRCASSRERTGDGRVLTIRVPGALVSRNHARVVRAVDRFVVVDDGSRNGTFVNGKRVQRATLSDRDVVECGHKLFVFREDVPLPERPEEDLHVDPAGAGDRLRTLSPELETRHALLRRVAPSALPVLLLGESGTGKEVVARALAELSGRGGPFVAVNCGAIPEGLVESQLFGHVKGAFSGASRDEPGVFRAADGGTLFLDELAELPATSQVAFLRALEEAMVTPVGTTRPVPVDVRVIAATNRPLHERVAQGLFREDLLARVSSFTHRLAPLRERIWDLGLLVGGLLPALAQDPASVVVRPEVGLRLLAHGWPLNVRELRSCLATALVVANGEPLGLPHVLPALSEALGASTRSDEDIPARLTRLLEEHHGNVAAVARAFGKAPFQIHRWMKQYGVEAEAFRRK